MSGTLKEIRDHIQSIKKTQQFTNAMKLVSAAKLRKNHPVLLKHRRYQGHLGRILRQVITDNEGFTTKKVIANPESACHIILTSNRGLCGLFNNQIIKEAIENISNQFEALFESGNLRLVCIGEKGFQHLKKEYPDYPHIENHSELLHNFNNDAITQFCKKLFSEFEAKTLESIHITYSHFESNGNQRVKTHQWMPIMIKKEPSEKANFPNYHFEPSSNILIQELMPEAIFSTFYTILLENITSENKARMTAMTKATQNAGDLISELKLKYNKARQNAITEELIDIVNAAEALRKP